jgi:hypothetical protein
MSAHWVFGATITVEADTEGEAWALAMAYCRQAERIKLGSCELDDGRRPIADAIPICPQCTSEDIDPRPPEDGEAAWQCGNCGATFEEALSARS